MKRLVFSISIIVVIVALGVVAIVFIGAQNNELYGKLDNVIYSYESGADATAPLDELEAFAGKYVKRLSIVADEQMLEELFEAVITLKTLYYDSSEEFATECARIRLLADRIYRREIPDIGRIL